MVLKYFLWRIKYYFTYHNSNFEHVVVMNALCTMLDEQLFPVYIGGQTFDASSLVGPEKQPHQARQYYSISVLSETRSWI